MTQLPGPRAVQQRQGGQDRQGRGSAPLQPPVAPGLASVHHCHLLLRSTSGKAQGFAWSYNPCRLPLLFPPNRISALKAPGFLLPAGEGEGLLASGPRKPGSASQEEEEDGLCPHSPQRLSGSMSRFGTRQEGRTPSSSPEENEGPDFGVPSQEGGI